MIRETFILTVRNLLDDVEDKEDVLGNTMELMEELYAMIDRPRRYRRKLISEWDLARGNEIETLSNQLSTAMGILKYLDDTLKTLVTQGLIHYKSEVLS